MSSQRRDATKIGKVFGIVLTNGGYVGVALGILMFLSGLLTLIGFFVGFFMIVPSMASIWGGKYLCLNGRILSISCPACNEVHTRLMVPDDPPTYEKQCKKCQVKITIHGDEVFCGTN